MIFIFFPSPFSFWNGFSFTIFHRYRKSLSFRPFSIMISSLINDRRFVYLPVHNKITLANSRWRIHSNTQEKLDVILKCNIDQKFECTTIKIVQVGCSSKKMCFIRFVQRKRFQPFWLYIYEVGELKKWTSCQHIKRKRDRHQKMRHTIFGISCNFHSA